MTAPDKQPAATGEKQQLAKLLVIDDAYPIRKILHQRLTDAGYRVTSVANGLEGIEIVTMEFPDLILLDARMPVLDGFQTLEKLKQHSKTKTIPVIMLTAEAGGKDVMRAWELGAADYIAKPFAWQTVLEKVRKVLNNDVDAESGKS